MSQLWRWIAGFGRFWYGFVIGDDWVGAAGVAVMIGATWGLVQAGITAIWAGPAVIVGTAVILVHRGLRRSDPVA